MMIVPNQMRAQTTAIYYFVISVLGLTLGPLMIAVFTDSVFADESMLRYSISIVTGGAGLIALLFLVASIRDGDLLIGIASVVFLVACVLFLVAYPKR